MNVKTLVNSILNAVALAFGISIIILSFLMDFACAVNIRFFIIFLSIAVFCLALAGIISIKK